MAYNWHLEQQLKQVEFKVNMNKTNENLAKLQQIFRDRSCEAAAAFGNFSGSSQRLCFYDTCQRVF